MTNPIIRCPWPDIDDPANQAYHDHEWGKLNLDEQYLFEMLVLESFQSGLSWSIILHKRDNFRQAFANFDVAQIAQFNAYDQERLLHDQGIVRNRLKIAATINNAQVLNAWHQEGKRLGTFLQAYIPEPLINHPQHFTDIPATTPLATKIAKALKTAGFKFVGPVTTYSFLQAVGLINDHLDSCSFKL